MNEYDMLEKRVSKLETQREEDYEKTIDNNKNLALIVQELKGITKTMEELSKSWQIAIKETESKNEQQTSRLEKKIEEIEKKIADLKNEIDARTIEKDSKEYTDIKNKVIWLIISAILGFVIGMILK